MATETQRIKGLERLKDARVREVAAETCHTIQQAFPEAEFRVYPHPSYRGAIVEVYADSDDLDAVVVPVVDRLVDLLVDEDISIRVWPSSRAWLRPDE